MKKAVRHSQILKLLQEKSAMTTNEIARNFDISLATIRRDIIELTETEPIRSSHGLVSYINPQEVLGINDRVKIDQIEKQRIALLAHGLIAPGSSIILDSGTTTLALASLLKSKPLEDLRVVTNSIPAAKTLAEATQVIVPCGVTEPEQMALIGPDADDYFNHITADILFLGTTGVRGSMGLTSSSTFQLSIKRQMIQSANKVVALVDSSKFTTNSLNMFCSFEDIDVIISTKTEQTEAVLAQIAAKGVEVLYTNDIAPPAV